MSYPTRAEGLVNMINVFILYVIETAVEFNFILPLFWYVVSMPFVDAFLLLLLPMKYPYIPNREIGRITNFYSFTYSLTTCLGQGIRKYREYRPDTRLGRNKYSDYRPERNTIYNLHRYIGSISIYYLPNLGIPNVNRSKENYGRTIQKR